MRKPLTQACLAVAGLLMSAATQAEQFVYVTATQIGVVDASDPQSNVLAGGPLAYSLPAGFTVLGADYDRNQASLHLLARREDVCQAYTVDLETVSASRVSLTPLESYGCSGPIPGDFDTLVPEGQIYEYVVAAGGYVYDVLKQAMAPTFSATRLPVIGAQNLVAIAFPGPEDARSEKFYGIDKGLNAIVELEVAGETAAGDPTGLKVVASKALDISLDGRISFDYARATDPGYLLSGGSLFTVDPASGRTARLGTLPAGTLAVTLKNAKASFALSTRNGNIAIASTKGKIVSAKVVEQHDKAPNDYDYPYGFFEFSISDLSPGDEVEVTITVPDGMKIDGSTLVKCADSFPCTDRIIGTRIGHSISFKLRDGVNFETDGDADGLVNGIIADPVAIAFPKTEGTADAGKGAGAWTFTGLLGLAFGALMRWAVSARAVLAKWLSGVLAASLLSACASGQRIETQQYSQLVVGKTTQQQLIAVLGEPKTRGFIGDDQMLGYTFSKVDATSYLPIVGMLKNGAQNQLCTFIFGADNFLKSKNCTEGKASGGLLGGR